MLKLIRFQWNILTISIINRLLNAHRRILRPFNETTHNIQLSSFSLPLNKKVLFNAQPTTKPFNRSWRPFTYFPLRNQPNELQNHFQSHCYNRNFLWTSIRRRWPNQLHFPEFQRMSRTTIPLQIIHRLLLSISKRHW